MSLKCSLQMQFRRDLRQRLSIVKKVALRKQLDDRKRKRINSPTQLHVTNIHVPLPTVNHPPAAIHNDNERCRLCGKKLRASIRCAGCEGLVCKKCSQLQAKEWKKKDNEKYWFCKTCDNLLLLADQTEK